MTTALADATIDDVLAWRDDELPRIRYLLGLRRYWMRELYPRLRARYDARLAHAPEPRTRGEARPIVESLPGVRHFLWLDAHIQHRLWEECGGFAERRLRDYPDLLEPRDSDLGELRLDAAFEQPDYYTRYDIHHQPGHIWQDDAGAVLYALGARVVHVGKSDPFALHDAFVEEIPVHHPSRVLDMGCGFGKTTFSLKKRYQDAEVVGVDLSAPCLRLGRRMASERGLEITWQQASSENVPEPDGSYDVVAMSMLLHEQPLDHVAQTLAEAHRLLAPGGAIVALEPWLTGDPFRDVLGEHHSELTGEPYIREFRNADVEAMLMRAGFSAPSMQEWAMPGAPKASELGSDQWASAWGLLTARKE